MIAIEKIVCYYGSQGEGCAMPRRATQGSTRAIQEAEGAKHGAEHYCGFHE